MTEGYFPGSRQKIRPPAGIPKVFQIPDEFGKDYPLSRGLTRLYTIGEVAELLNRKPGTIRMWERTGKIPKAVYSTRGANDDPRGRRRLYSKPQVEALIRIALEEKILYNLNLHISQTKFTPKVFAAFRELAGK